MGETLDEILAECLKRMEAGVSLDDCLADLPVQAAKLESLLRLSVDIKALNQIKPRPEFARNARTVFVRQLATRGQVVTSGPLNRHISQEPKAVPQRRLSMSALKFGLAALLAFSLTAGGVAYAANASGPGSALHGLDLAIEQVQLSLATSTSSQVELRLQFATERLAEAESAFAKHDVVDGQAAVDEYGTEISAAAKLIGGPGGADQAALNSLIQDARGIHQDVLTHLLDTVPEQAKSGIQRALDASNPAAHGPETVPTTDSGVGPGPDISACAKSLSQADAQALADLARQHGVDYQYVLQNFCVLGTLEQVQAMLSSLPAGPSGQVPTSLPPTSAPVPAGPSGMTPGPQVNPPGRP
jgi:uncharacterized protein YidB (DUF937 family)